MLKAIKHIFASSLLFAVLLTTVVTLWEWLENPGQIFRNEQGTHWQPLFDTAISWFLPAFSYALVLLVLFFLLKVAIQRIKLIRP
ncbi:hypothetical protein [Corallincola spongiicola]|uniref:Uncharacterized protein n=1 Tax=Corallincola spongiicola TaxID=2520508 RepID=A0ABY1WMJ2_9GAMM|nr:hypothetical protein [Corallincola spongiicola]TAA43649.1 hypothetical protein EXY25_13930 [Corallincola spongiicola]